MSDFYSFRNGKFEEREDHGELDLREGTFYRIEESREMTPEQREALGIPLPQYLMTVSLKQTSEFPSRTFFI